MPRNTIWIDEILKALTQFQHAGFYVSLDPDNPSITIAKKRYDIRLTRHDEWEVDEPEAERGLSRVVREMGG